MPKHAINIGVCIQKRQSPICTHYPRYFSPSVLGCSCLLEVCCKAPALFSQLTTIAESRGYKIATFMVPDYADLRPDDSWNKRDKLDQVETGQISPELWPTIISSQ